MRIRTIVAGTAALALLAGCSTGGGTTGTPTNATQPTSTSSSSGGAPKVSNPLNLAAVEAAPCNAVTAAQLTAYGLPGVTGSVNTGSLGASCQWSGTLTAAEMSVGMGILPAGTNLDSQYARKDTFAVFEERPAIQGYPAIVSLLTDQRKEGNCELTVGASDERAILVTFLSDEKSKYFADPCAGATEFANLAITTIKAGVK
ncbi:DUF3558 domain-containing protein [Lentzea sp. PSKA42]|uniref:DUF3558 domain-containing protein n=1 Tax=Lentzea indica TaxID=2604800 RepID=A0ABX1FB50_9PSEU|nr:DUF3558 domain-containing protein [Lentzea indica]NKE56138.1 DUF3558 domain-containing protein [Lentzea indica]